MAVAATSTTQKNVSDKYQLASDGYDGVAYSGVIRSDGKWVPAEAGNPDWHEYCDWLHESEDNVPAPFRSVRDGGLAIKLEPNQSAVGSMLDSVEDLDGDQPPPAPRRIPHRADLYNPPVVPTDASHSPAREQRSDAREVLSADERKARQDAHEWNRTHPAPVEGVWTQTEVDSRRKEFEAQQAAYNQQREQHMGETVQAATERHQRENDEARQYENAEGVRRQTQAHPPGGSSPAPSPARPAQPPQRDDKK